MKTWTLISALALFFSLTACSNDDEKDGGKKDKLSAGSCKSLPGTGHGEMRAESIYGRDDRRDWFEVTDPALKTWARSTLALIPKANLTSSGIGQGFSLTSTSYQSENKLCSNQPFLSQPTAAFCSGFYVGGDLIVTAGHCLMSTAECLATAFVFDYAAETPGSNFSSVSSANVYSCKKIVSQRFGADDYAIVQLDRPVTGRVPFSVRRTGSPLAGQQLVMIGHPAGLPSKIADGGAVITVNSRIVADVDAFAGNSGSVIIDRSTGRVEGILVSGNADFDDNGSCKVEHLCGSDCDGEKVFPIAKVAGMIPLLPPGASSEDGVQISPLCSP